MSSPPFTGNDDLDAFLYKLQLDTVDTGTTGATTIDTGVVNADYYPEKYIQVRYATSETGANINTRPFSYNTTGSLVGGTDQVGDLAIGTPIMDMVIIFRMNLPQPISLTIFYLEQAVAQIKLTIHAMLMIIPFYEKII